MSQSTKFSQNFENFKNHLASLNKKPEIFVFLSILIFGLFLTLIIPIGAGTDEETHIGRIWEMASGELIPNRQLTSGPNYPCAFFETSYYNDPFYTPVDWKDWTSLFNRHINWNSFCDIPTRSRYFPTMYLFQALIMGVGGRLFDFSIPVLYYLIRFSYVLIYALLGLFAVRNIPFGKWLFGILLLSPTSLFQASTVNIDSINNGVSFAFIAWILFLISSKSEGFKRSHWFVTVLLTFSVATIKINALPLLLLLLLVPRIKFGSKKWFFSFIILLVAAVAIVSLGWNYLAASDQLFTKTDETYDTVSQLRNIVQNPAHYVSSVLFTLKTGFWDYLRDWIATTGYYFWQLPLGIHILYGLTLVMTFFVEANKGILRLKDRLFFLFLFILLIVATMTIFFLSYNNPEKLDIPGVYGRYFVFLMPLLLILFVPQKGFNQVIVPWIKVGIIITSVMVIISMYLIYHVDCGNTYLNFEKCELPRYRNWSIDTAAAISSDHDFIVDQTLISKCDRLSTISLYVKNEVQFDDYMISISGTDQEFLKISDIEVVMFNEQVNKLVYSFDPVEGSKNAEFTINIQMTKKPDNTIFLYSTQDEYTDGKLTIDNKDVTGDLYLNYGCKIGLRELFSKD